MALRVGSLFTGTGALDLAVMDVFDAEVVWHSQYEPPDKNGKEDTNQYAARILARHWPGVPNLGDITKVDWPAVAEQHGPVDIVTGGFPCTDVSSAGRRAGLTPDTRSGLWNHMSYAISILQPRLVIIENVEGLLSAPADRGLGLDAEALEEEARAGRILRALGAVLGDLASLGLDAEWARVAASEVGAPHQRKRVIIYAWPAALHPRGLGRWHRPRIVGGLGAAGRGAEAVQDADIELGNERRLAASGEAEGWGARADAGRRSGTPAADASGPGLEVGRVQPDGPQLPTPERGRREPPADTDSVEPERRGVAGVLGSQAAAESGEGDQRQRTGDAAGDRGEAAADSGRGRRQGHSELSAGRDGLRQRVRHDADRCQPAVPDPAGDGRDEGRPEPARVEGRPDAAECSSAAPADTHRGGQREDVLQLRAGQPDLDWGDYGPAIRRWERILGRPAPWPTDALGRLSPVFTEWLMGLPDGWVTDTPGLTRPAMLRALGNGVVWQQAAAAIRHLHERATADDQAAA